MDSQTEYSRLQFNEYGDNVFDRPVLAVTEEELSEVHIPAIGDATIDRLNVLNQTLRDKGATLLVTPYPTPISQLFKRFQIRNLTADMEVQTAEFESILLRHMDI